MPQIILPNGQKRIYEKPLTGAELAADISISLSKKAVAMKKNHILCDLQQIIEDEECTVEIITREHEDALPLIRHDAAHVLAEAVQSLYPETKVTIGPIIENGFYYDFAREKPFAETELELIEKKMHEIITHNQKLKMEVWTREKAIEYFSKKGETYKVELINDIDRNEPISIYSQGEWLDLCRGPHMVSTGQIGKAFRLLKTSGAYWRGDAKNPMLQRIYGTAWANEKQLVQYLDRIELAKKRDHRKLGVDMNLFHLSDAAPGSVFWHEKGWMLFQKLIQYIREEQTKIGYIEVNTPDMLDKTLWEKSGHWEKFYEHMFICKTQDQRQFALKPMNCPGHLQIFRAAIRSYKDMPIKIAEFGKVHRYEPSGALHGIMRIRSFTQDDAHIFCTPEQLSQECLETNNFIINIYKSFGFNDIKIQFADKPEKSVGSDEIWRKSENALIEAIESAKLPYQLNKGQGAFYGPKLEYILEDSLGRQWQCGTLQVDLNMPERLQANYIDANGQKKIPVMLHRAVLGSIERFIGILIEHHGGNLPLWLAPVQMKVCTITDATHEYAGKIFDQLKKHNLRAEIDTRNEKIGYKIRQHAEAKIPILVICGKKEEEENSVAIRRLGSNKTQNMPLQQFIEQILKDIKTLKNK